MSDNIFSFEEYREKLFEDNQKLKAENEEYLKRPGLPVPVSCENSSGNISVEINIDILARRILYSQ